MASMLTELSGSSVPDVVRYIATQRERHSTRTCKEKFVAFLERHEIEFDTERLWG